MQTLYILSGSPGSGKTTKAKEMAETIDTKLHIFDLLPGAHNPSKYLAVRKQMWNDISQELADGFSVICDDCHHTVEWRKELITNITTPCKKVLVVTTTPLEECLERNRNREARLPDFVVSDIYNRFEVPTLEEGWDEIIYI